VIALQHRISGLDIGLLLTTWVVFSAAVVLPAGLFVLVRRLVPRSPLAAGFTALVVPFFAMFPYGAAAWSAITLIAGLALTPATLVMVGRAIEPNSRRWAHLAIAATAVVGVIATHSSQIAFLAVVLAILEIASMWTDRADRRALIRRIENLAILTMAVVVLFSPTLRLLVSAASERSAFADHPYLSFPAAVGSLANLSFAMPGSQPALAALVVVGILLATRDRVLARWTVCLAVMVLLFTATVVTGGVWHRLRPLTEPWYYGSWRTSYHIPFVGSVFAGYGLAMAAVGVGRLVRRRWPSRPSVVGTGVVAAALVFAGSPTLLPQSVHLVRNAWATNARTTQSMVAAFDYLKVHTAHGRGAVLNEERDGSAWMYAAASLRPLLAVYPYSSDAATKDRLLVMSRIAEYDSDPKVRDLVARWGIEYVMVNDVGFVDEPPRLSASALRRSARFEEVFSKGPTHVFRILR
jgi:hypothetical protein